MAFDVQIIRCRVDSADELAAVVAATRPSVALPMPGFISASILDAARSGQVNMPSGNGHAEPAPPIALPAPAKPKRKRDYSRERRSQPRPPADGTKSAQIIAYLKKHPNAETREVANALQTSYQLVRHVQRSGAAAAAKRT